MKKISLLILTIFLASCSINIVNNEATTALGDEEKNKEKKNQNIVCEKVYNTSSRIPKKICTTVAEREKLEKEKEASKKILRDAQTRSGTIGGDMQE